MYCEKCGGQISSGAKFCRMCGAEINSGLTAPDITNVNQTSQIQTYQPAMQQPRVVVQPNFHQYRSSRDIPFTPVFWIAFLFALLSFVGIFQPWFVAEIDVFGKEKTESATLLDEFDNMSLMSTENAEKDSSDDTNSAGFYEEVMTFAAIWGYFFEIVAFAIAISHKRYSRLFFSLAFFGFVISIISAFATASEIRKQLNDLIESYDLDSASASISVSIGAWIAIIAFSVAMELARVDFEQRRKEYNRYYQMNN